MNNKSWYAFTVSVLIAIAWFVAMRTGAYAHWRPEYAQASPDVRNWFKSQRAPTTNVPCCDISDGEFAEEDIRYDEKGVGHFWTRWSKHLEWMLVPDDVVIQEPNKWGRPVVFWAEDSVNNVMYIRCYARGAGI